MKSEASSTRSTPSAIARRATSLPATTKSKSRWIAAASPSAPAPATTSRRRKATRPTFSRERCSKEFGQFSERAIGLFLIVDRTVRRSPTVIRAIIGLTFELPSPGFEGALEVLDGGLRHGAIFDGVSEIEPRFHARQDVVRTHWGIRKKAPAMKRRGCRNLVRTCGGDSQRHSSTEAVTDNTRRAAFHGFLRREKIQIS